MSDAPAIRPQLTKRQTGITLIMIMIIGVLSNYIYCLAVYVGPLHELHGWSMNSIALTYSVAMFCEIPTYIIGGALSNKFGMKKILVASGVLYGLSILASGLTSSVLIFIITQGVIGSLTMYGIYVCTLALINVMYPDKKGFVIGLLYGLQAAGAAFMAPMANYFVEAFNASTALVIQGVIFTVVMFICTMLVTDPYKGDKELMAKVQEEADEQELEEAMAGRSLEERPSMRWKRALLHPGIWILFVSVILIQMFGNVLVVDISEIAQSTYDITAARAAWIASAFAIGCGVGGIVVGIISDKIGPYRTTFWLGIVDGVLLIILAMVGAHSLTVFIIICIVQGFTYNGMTALNPIMITDAYDARDLGIMLAVIAVAYGIVGTIGPQLGLEVPFIPMLLICAVCSILGGFFSSFAKKSVNKYYNSIDSKCQVR